MGAELSRPLAGSDITNLREDSRRRVGSSSALDARRQSNKQSGFPTSASTTSLSSLGQPKSRSSSVNSKSLFSSMRRSRNNSKSANTPPESMSSGDNAVESLDLPIVEWEGYVTKRGHLVRNWKMRFFTLEGNLVSYYENKVDARNRSHLKGRVNVASVKMDKVAKNGHGFDFSFETTEGKVFYCSVPTHFDQLAWVYFLEAGVDTVSMRQNNRPVYGTYRHGVLPDMHTDKAYEAYRRMLEGDVEVVTELLSYFSKDLVFSSSYPKSTPFSGDYFGREGFLHFLGAFQSNVDLIDIKVQECELDANGKSLIVKGSETLKSKHSGAVITQSWSHRVRFGPYGRILRFRVDVDLKTATGNWKSFGVKNPYSEMSDASIRSNRSLSISMKDFTVYNVIGKGGFGTVVNAVKKSDGQIYALKILEKGKMTKYDVESSFTEMRVAQNIHHPFIAGLRIAFQSRTKLFLGMNYYGGGDLFHHMSKGSSCRIPSDRAHFYTAELVLGIHHLHQHDILYRDIKPENVMIDAEGHVALVDFGLAKLHVSEYKGAKTMAGSPQYTAPELLLPKAKRSYGKAADWWSLGILLYEMSVGKSPFYDNNIEKMYQKIQNDPLVFPSKPALTDELKSILRGFLQKDPTKRLGTNISDILQHPYFRGIDWDLLLKKQITPPWKPKLSSPLDVEYVDTEFTDLDVHNEVQSPTDKSAAKSKGFLSLVSSRSNREKAAPPVQDPTFKDFTYFCEDPDSLVEVTNLVSELRPPPPPTSPLLNEEDSDESDRLPEHDNSMPSECEGTPLSSFVENGHLNPMPISPSQFHEGLKKLEASMTEQFERVEVTIFRERPPIKKTNANSSSSSEEQDRVHVQKLVISHGPSIPTETTASASTTSPSANSRGLSGTSEAASHEPNSPASRGQSAVSSTAVNSQPIMEAEF
ncbi:RAC family serine/threonine-protein kinase [Phytophthora infestans T30-4]|uniref:RAC family serine/threonine-protein kinase n=1 Tax=Phytophthora infestans (strain T30-4) TaxID=403677 RepID=D0NY41_PHYIT|nr:RAC family serine/threonine-protein kinase [Phytophthora infestans T30-4]EEY67999.1 RAC family serine/threonine-protein kinase [Phytophthora infestans T30-4]|eukprot:XP_002997698.1 RAC family serine/threonine-protein kinase [Phytophthora infestans T30-4]